MSHYTLAAAADDDDDDDDDDDFDTGNNLHGSTVRSVLLLILVIRHCDLMTMMTELRTASSSTVGSVS